MIGKKEEVYVSHKKEKINKQETDSVSRQKTNERIIKSDKYNEVMNLSKADVVKRESTEILKEFYTIVREERKRNVKVLIAESRRLIDKWKG